MSPPGQHELISEIPSFPVEFQNLDTPVIHNGIETALTARREISLVEPLARYEADENNLTPKSHRINSRYAEDPVCRALFDAQWDADQALEVGKMDSFTPVFLSELCKRVDGVAEWIDQIGLNNCFQRVGGVEARKSFVAQSNMLLDQVLPCIPQTLFTEYCRENNIPPSEEDTDSLKSVLQHYLANPYYRSDILAEVLAVEIANAIKDKEKYVPVPTDVVIIGQEPVRKVDVEQQAGLSKIREQIEKMKLVNQVKPDDTEGASSEAVVVTTQVAAPLEEKEKPKEEEVNPAQEPKVEQPSEQQPDIKAQYSVPVDILQYVQPAVEQLRMQIELYRQGSVDQMPDELRQAIERLSDSQPALVTIELGKILRMVAPAGIPKGRLDDALIHLNVALRRSTAHDIGDSDTLQYVQEHVLAMLTTDEVSSNEEEPHEVQTQSEQVATERLRNDAEEQLLNKLEPYAHYLAAESVDFDKWFTEMRDEYYATDSIKKTQEEMITFAVQYFYPSKGKYWQIPQPNISACHLNDFIQCVKDTKQLPQPILEMCTYAALGAERGIVNEQSIDAADRVSGAKGFITLLGNCPQSLQMLKERMIEETFIKKMQQGVHIDTQLKSKNSDTAYLTRLLAVGFVPPPSKDFFHWFFQQADHQALSTENPSTSHVELMNFLINNSLTWQEGGKIDNFDNIYLPLLWEQTALSSTDYKLEQLNTDSKLAEDFLNSALHFVQRAPDGRIRFDRLFRLITFPDYPGLAVSPNMEIQMLEEVSKSVSDDEISTIKHNIPNWILNRDQMPDFDKADWRTTLEQYIHQQKKKIELQSTISEQLRTTENGSLQLIQAELDALKNHPEFAQWRERMTQEVSKLIQEILSSKEIQGEQERATSYDLSRLLEKDENVRRYFYAIESIYLHHLGNEGYSAGSLTPFIEHLDELGDSVSHEEMEGVRTFIEGTFDESMMKKCWIKDQNTFEYPSQIKPYAGYAGAYSTLSVENATDVVAFFDQLETNFEQFCKMDFFGKMIDQGTLKKELGLWKEYYSFCKTNENQIERKKILNTLDSPKELLKLLHTIFAFKASEFARKRSNIEVAHTSDMLSVQNGTSLSLVEQMGSGRRPFEALKLVTPISIDVAKGTCTLLTGPTGGGKSTVLQTLADNTIWGSVTAPVAEHLIVPDLVTAPIHTQVGETGRTTANFIKGKSFLQNTATETAKVVNKPIWIGDEPYRGAPAAFRIPLTTARILREMQSGGHTILATHQGREIITLLEILGFGDEVLPKFVTPDDRKMHDGLAGSFGLEMLEMQGCEQSFVDLCRLLLQASESAVEEGALEVPQYEQKAVPEGTVFASEETLQEAGFRPDTGQDSILAGIVRHAHNGSVSQRLEVARMYREMRHLVCESSPDVDARSGIEHFKSLGIVDHQIAIGQVGKINTLSAECEHIERFEQIVKEIREEKIGGTVDLISLFNLLRAYDHFKADEYKSTLQILIQDEFSDEKKAECLARLGDIQNKSAEKPQIDENPETIQKELKNIGLNESFLIEWIRKLKESGVDTQKYNLQWQDDLRSRIDTDPLSVLGDIRTIFALSQNHPTDKLLQLGSYDSRKLAQLMLLAKQGEVTTLLQKGSDGISLAQRIGLFQQSIDPEMDRITFESYMAFSTRSDNQSTPWCVPTVVTDGSLPGPLHCKEGYNLGIAQVVGRENYIPQTLFMRNETEPYALADMPPSMNGKVEKPINVIPFTGLQGGGKTMSVQMMLQFELWRKAIGEVPARAAWMRPEPAAVIGVLAPRITEGNKSTFMNEASKIAHIVANSGENIAVFLDEPGDGTDDKETAAIVAALGVLVDQKGGWTAFTNHTEAAYRAWQMIKPAQRPAWYPVGYEYSNDPEKKFALHPGMIGGADTFRVAEEMGISQKEIALAQKLHQIRQEYHEWQNKLL